MLAGAARAYVERYAVAPGARGAASTTNDAGYDAAARARRRRASSSPRSSTRATGARRCSTAPSTGPARRWPPPRASGASTGAVAATARSLRPAARRGRLEPRRSQLSARRRAAALGRGRGRVRPATPCRTAGTSPARRPAPRPRRVRRARAPPRRAAAATGCRVDRTATSRPPRGGRPPRAVRGRSRRRRAAAGTSTSSTCSATRRSPTSAAPSAPACARPSTSSASRRSAPAQRPGRTSGVLDARRPRRAARRGRSATLGPTTFRPPARPGRASRCSPGRDRGDAVRPRAHDRRSTPGTSRTARCSRTSASGSGRGTTRARGEDMDAAVLRECARRARRASAMMDASTLGKIDVQGPDAADVPQPPLHRRLRQRSGSAAAATASSAPPTGWSSTTASTMRLAEDRFLVTTTTGNAAAVLDWFEEWLQTEWPELRVHCTSVTEQWATVAVVGPRSRDVRRARSRRTSTSAARASASWTSATADGRRAPGARLPRLASPASSPTRSTSPAWHGARAVGGGQGRRRSRTASRRTGPRRCTCCAPRRAT